MCFAKRIEEECGLKLDISSNGTYIISFGGLMKDDAEYCTCELTVDTSTISKGEYKGNQIFYNNICPVFKQIFLSPFEMRKMYKIKRFFITLQY